MDLITRTPVWLIRKELTDYCNKHKSCRECAFYCFKDCDFHTSDMLKLEQFYKILRSVKR